MKRLALAVALPMALVLGAPSAAQAQSGVPECSDDPGALEICSLPSGELCIGADVGVLRARVVLPKVILGIRMQVLPSATAPRLTCKG